MLPRPKSIRGFLEFATTNVSDLLMPGTSDVIQSVTSREAPEPASAGLVLLGIARQTVGEMNYLGEPVSPLGVHFF